MHRMATPAMSHQGGDVGALVRADMMGRQAPEGLAVSAKDAAGARGWAAAARPRGERRDQGARRDPGARRVRASGLATGWSRPRRAGATIGYALLELRPLRWRAGCSTTTRTTTRRCRPRVGGAGGRPHWGSGS